MTKSKHIFSDTLTNKYDITNRTIVNEFIHFRAFMVDNGEFVVDVKDFKELLEDLQTIPWKDASVLKPRVDGHYLCYTSTKTNNYTMRGGMRYVESVDWCNEQCILEYKTGEGFIVTDPKTTVIRWREMLKDPEFGWGDLP